MKYSPKLHQAAVHLMIFQLCVPGVSISTAQEPAVSAIIPPLIIGPADHGDNEPVVELRDQKITVSLLQNAALVHLENFIENPVEDSTDFTVRLTVEGYVVIRETDTLGMTSRLLDVDLWNGDESVVPRLMQSDTTTDDVLPVTLGPHGTTTVEALFWVPTMIGASIGGYPADSALIPAGDRLLMIVLGGGDPNREVANTSLALLIFTDGLSPVDSLMRFDPLPDEQSDTTVTWNWSETDDAPAEEIVVSYHTSPVFRTPYDTIVKISSHARCCGLPDLREPESEDE